MSALLNPVKLMRRSIKWALIAHTTTMFSLLTVSAAIALALVSDGYIDNREFPGSATIPPGPFGSPWPNALTVVSVLGFPLNQWLADGLLVSFIPNHYAEYLTQAVAPAIPLSNCLFHGFSVDHLPVSDLCCHYWYASVSFTNR
jgi:hypothetical protein